MSVVTPRLSRPQVTLLNKASSALADAILRADAAEKAGIDVSQQRAEIEYLRQRLEQIQTHIGGNG